MRYYEIIKCENFRELLLDFPDDGGRTFESMIDSIPDVYVRQIVTISREAFKLTINNPKLEMVLLVAGLDLGVTSEDRALLPGDLLVPYGARATCQRILAENGATDARWTELYWISGLPEGIAAFHDVWLQSVEPMLGWV